jgi:hypothetical protein
LGSEENWYTPKKHSRSGDFGVCDEHNFILVTNNRKSMPVHLVDHLAQGGHIPGIFVLNQDLSIGQNIEELIVIVDASFDNEYQDRIIHLPLT